MDAAAASDALPAAQDGGDAGSTGPSGVEDGDGGASPDAGMADAAAPPDSSPQLDVSPLVDVQTDSAAHIDAVDGCPDGCGPAPQDILETDAGNGAPDTEDAGEAPSPCGTCEPGSAGCLDEVTGWYCSSTAVGKNPPPCWHVQLTPCLEGKCSQGNDACICEPTGNTVCKPWWFDEVYEETTCPSFPGNLVKKCPYPGCFLGDCQEEIVKPTVLWPRPTGMPLRRVLPLETGRALVAGTNNSLFEYVDEEWRDVREMSNWIIYDGLFRDPDGSVYAIGKWHRWLRTGPTTWEGLSYDAEASFSGDGALMFMQGSIPNDAWALDKDEIYLAMPSGVLAHWKDGVSTWVLLNYTPQTAQNHTLGVWARTPDDVWAVGGGGLARRYNGDTWSLVPGLSVESGGTSADLTAVRGTVEGDVYVVRPPEVLKRSGAGWTAVFTLPEPDVPNRIWVGDNDHIWVWGRHVASRFDGIAWQSWSLGYPGTKATLEDIACLVPNDCWAVGGDGLVLHFDGSTWEQLSEGQGESTLANDVASAVWAASPEEVFVGIHHRGPNKVSVRRLTLQEGEVTDSTTWEVGEVSTLVFNWILRGLWGTGPDDVYVATKRPMHFDGTQWAPVELPPNITEKWEALTLTGRGDDLYISFIHPGTASCLIHRKAGGGPWTVTPTINPYFDLWVHDDGTVYGLNQWVVDQILPGGEKKKVMTVYHTPKLASYSRLAVSHAGEVLCTNDSDNLFELLTADGQVNHYVKGFTNSDLISGIMLPPTGPGFLFADFRMFYEFGTTNAAPLTKPVSVDSYRPFTFVGAETSSAYAAPWGDIYVGEGHATVHRLPAPWK